MMQFSSSLKKNSDFQKVFQNRKSKVNKYLIMYVLENGTDYNRLGIVVSKKVGNSVVRHRVKRLIKESYRLHEPMFSRGLDIVVVARVGANAINYDDTESALLHLMKLHHAINVEQEN